MKRTFRHPVRWMIIAIWVLCGFVIVSALPLFALAAPEADTEPTDGYSILVTEDSTPSTLFYEYPVIEEGNREGGDNKDRDGNRILGKWAYRESDGSYVYFDTEGRQAAVSANDPLDASKLLGCGYATLYVTIDSEIGSPSESDFLRLTFVHEATWIKYEYHIHPAEISREGTIDIFIPAGTYRDVELASASEGIRMKGAVTAANFVVPAGGKGKAHVDVSVREITFEDSEKDEEQVRGDTVWEEAITDDGSFENAETASEETRSEITESSKEMGGRIGLESLFDSENDKNEHGGGNGRAVLAIAGGCLVFLCALMVLVFGKRKNEK